MTDFERRAILGDAEAQRECTEKGIVLACPFCGQEKIRILPVCGQGFIECPKCHCTTDLVDSVETAIKQWNTRPAPPIGRCGECEHWADWGACGRPDNGWDAPPMQVDDFCSYFKPKGDEENAAD